MNASTSLSNPRRPRARVRASQDRDLVDGEILETSSNRTALSPTPAISTVSSPVKGKNNGHLRRSSSNTSEGLEYFEPEDDDDDFFNANRGRGGGTINALKPTQLAPQIPIQEEEEEDELSEGMQSTPQDNRKKVRAKRAYKPAWTRNDSIGKKKSGLNSDMSDSESADTLSGDEIVPVKKTNGKQESLQRKKARQSSSSPEIEPPPSASPARIRELHGLIRRHEEATMPNLNDDEPELPEEELEKHEIHPDLLRMRRGRGAPFSRFGGGIPSSQTPAQSTKTESKAFQRSPVKSAQSAIAIELSDSDNDRTGPTTRSTARQMRDSSPIEIVEVRNSKNSGPSQGPMSKTQQNLVSQKTTTTKKEDTPPPVNEPVAVDRKTVIMKAEGGIEVHVSVRPTTLVKTVLDHFIDLHRDSIPKNRISKVRIRFDGEVLKDKQTMEDIDIEDEDQMDVIW